MNYPECVDCIFRCKCCKNSDCHHTCGNCYHGLHSEFQPKDYIAFCPMTGKNISDRDNVKRFRVCYFVGEHTFEYECSTEKEVMEALNSIFEENPSAKRYPDENYEYSIKRVAAAKTNGFFGPCFMVERIFNHLSKETETKRE